MNKIILAMGLTFVATLLWVNALMKKSHHCNHTFTVEPCGIRVSTNMLAICVRVRINTGDEFQTNLFLVTPRD